MIQESFLIDIPAGFLAATLYKPEKIDKNTKNVLFCHGFTGSRIEARRLFVNFARKLAENNFIVMTFDYRGHGESSGNFSDCTLLDWISDAAEAFSYFSYLPETREKNVSLLGYSMGGCIASYLTKYANTDKIILWAPLADPAILYENKISNLSDDVKKNFNKNGYYDRNGLKITGNFIEVLKSVNPVEEVIKSEITKIKIIHSEDDQVLDINQHALVYFERLKNAGKIPDMVIINEGGHSFAKIPSEERLFEESLCFLKME